MPSRTAAGPLDGSESIKELIRSHPSILEEGFRVLDISLKAGDAGTIDAIGVDRSGGLVIVIMDTGDPEAALARLLDAQIWSTDQRELLGRLYAAHGVDLDRPVRGFLLAPAFTHAFLRRLALLTPDITACLARQVAFVDGSRVAIEPAASLFGIPRSGRSGVGGNGAGARSSNDRRFWPDEVLPAEEDQNAVAPAGGPVSPEDSAWPGSPDEILPWDRPGDSAEVLAEPPSEVVAPAAVIETLTTEELQEFERFERQRRERDRRPT